MSRTDGIILDRRQLGTVQPDSFRGIKETRLGGGDHSNDDRSVVQSCGVALVEQDVCCNVPCLSAFCHPVCAFVFRDRETDGGESIN